MAKEVQVGSQAWAADLQQFRDAISSIGSDKRAIKGDFDQLISALKSLDDGWKGPGGLAFSEGIEPLSNAGNQMIDVIGDVITRLGITLQNYENAEVTNTKNLSHQPPPSGTNSKPSGSNHSAPAVGRSEASTPRAALLLAGEALSGRSEGATARTPLLPAVDASGNASA
jgi:uncharacterized protein YukE